MRILRSIARNLLTLSVVLVPTVGCGSSNGEVSGPVEVDDPEAKMLAQVSVELTAGLSSLRRYPDNAQVILNAMVARSALSRIGDIARAENVPGSLSEKIGMSEGFTDPSCISQSGGTITYEDCALTNGRLVDGTVSSTGAEMTLDLQMGPHPSYEGRTIPTEWMSGTLEISDNLLRGTLEYEVESAGAQINKVDVVYDVAFGDEGCPVGGQLALDESCEGCKVVSLIAFFGPSCGDVSFK